MSPPNQQAAAGTSFEAFLAGQQLTSVAIIDDSYDHWSVQAMQSAEADELWSLIENDVEAKKEVLAHAPEISSGADLTANRLKEVCDATGADCALVKVVQSSSFLQRIEQKAGAVKGIETLLTDRFKLSVHTQGIAARTEDILNVQVVFLDWRLGPDHEPDSKQKAARAARRIYKAFPDGKKPIIVLMSDDHDLAYFSNDFRKQSELIEGLFRAIPKHDLRDAQTLALHMLAIADSLKPAHVVQRFTDAVLERARGAAAEFEEAIRGLSLSDYANIRHLALKADGHPLGDYMCWLFSGFLSDSWFGKAIAAERELLDRFDFERMVAAPDQPSGMLAKIYHAAVFDMSVGPVKDHPQATASKDGRMRFPNLALGDIFLRKTMQATAEAVSPAAESAVHDQAKQMLAGAQAADDTKAGTGPAVEASVGAAAKPAEAETPASAAAVAKAGNEPEAARPVDAAAPLSDEAKTGKEVAKAASPPDLFVIMNAQCDLAMSPNSDRTIANTDSILLVPGRIRSLDEKGGDGGKSVAVTPLFMQTTVNEGKGSWVEWDLGAMKTVEYGWFDQWMTQAGGHERIARMRPLHALAMQRLLADRGTRVGLPSTPPIYRKLSVTLQSFDNKALSAELPDELGLVILAGNSPKTQKRLISLTITCLQKIRAAMVERRGKPSGKPTHNELDAAIMDAKTWQELVVPFELPEKGKTFFGDLLVVAPAHLRSEAVKSQKTIARLIVNLEESELA